MVTQIWHRNGFKIVNPDNPPTDSRMLDMFLMYNDAPKCFVKTNNYWFKLTRSGELYRVSRTLYLLPMKDWLRIALDDTFHPEIPSTF